MIGAVVAEFIGADRGLGFGILQASYSLNTPRMFAYIAIACALGVLMYWATAALESRVALRYPGLDDID